MADTALLPIDVLRQRMKCDPEAGTLWRWTGARWKEAFTATDSDGYKVGKACGRYLKAHRVIWALVHGAWPDGELDHEDGNRANNRIGNLRPATRFEQLQNVGLRSTNTSGYPGVSFHRAKGRWKAAIRHNGRRKHIGYFDTPAAAGAAYLAEKARLHTFSPTVRVAQ